MFSSTVNAAIWWTCLFCFFLPCWFDINTSFSDEVKFLFGQCCSPFNMWAFRSKDCKQQKHRLFWIKTDLMAGKGLYLSFLVTMSSTSMGAGPDIPVGTGWTTSTGIDIWVQEFGCWYNTGSFNFPPISPNLSTIFWPQMAIACFSAIVMASDQPARCGRVSNLGIYAWKILYHSIFFWLNNSQNKWSISGILVNNLIVAVLAFCQILSNLPGWILVSKNSNQLFDKSICQAYRKKYVI